MALRHRIVIVFAAAWGFSAISAAADWPTYRHDNRRSGATSESISAADLALDWLHRSSQSPQPAWAGAADVDAFIKKRGLGDARNYDPVFHPIIAGDYAYYASSADDAVHCLDLKTGEEKWNFTTGGPLRVAPSVANGRIYFGSDDGLAYCLEATSGKLVWQFRPPSPETRVINDGRLISLWPCRTGVLVDRGTAYFAMSMLPWKPSFICAVDATTGRTEGPGHYVRRVEDNLTLEAAMLASGTKLIALQGRSGPVVLKRETGEQINSLPGASTFAVLSQNDAFVSGPFSRDIGLRGTSVTNQQQLAWHPSATSLVVQDQETFVLGPESLSATLPAAAEKKSWSAKLTAALSLILAGDTLFVGCDGEVVAVDRHTGKILWRASVEGRAYGLAVGGSSLLVSTDEGCLYSFCRSDAAKAWKDRPVFQGITTNELKPQFGVKAGLSVTLATAPYVQFTTPREAIVRWQTAQPTATLLRYTIEGKEYRVEDATPRTEHSATMRHLPRNREVRYDVFASDGKEVGLAGSGVIDTFFNYATRPLPGDANTYSTSDARMRELATNILSTADTTTGVCLVLGSSDGRLAWELARQSQMRVIAVDDDADRIRALRDRWQRAGAYGVRLSASHVNSLEAAALPSMLANLIVDHRLLDEYIPSLPAAVVTRWLRPAGGYLYLANSSAGASFDQQTLEAFVKTGLRLEKHKGANSSLVLRRAPLVGSGDWSHQYGSADNSGYAGETLAGARTATDLEVQWIGRPGPRDHTDRQTRHPAPLSTGGRLYIQGQERIVTLDAYNGVPLWSLHVPGLERYDIPHDSSNWVANDDYLFTALGNRCWQISTRTGVVKKQHEVIPGNKLGVIYDWGYVSVQDELLVASANLQNANSKGWWGGEFWRDEEVNSTAASDNLFALDWHTGKRAWVYKGGIIPNSSITLADGKLFFVESRDPKVIEGYSGRVMMHDAWPERFLVALDVKTGEKNWEIPLHIQGGQAIFGMAWSDGKLVICSSGNSKFYVNAYSAKDGSTIWKQAIDWVARGHGAQYSRPVIVQETVFIRPFALELATGKLLGARMPGGGCGTYCASSDALFFRSGDITAWSPQTDQLSGFSRLRPGCWLSAVPAAGLLLSPEAGGGCSCGGWMETSIAFAPAEFPPPSFKTRDRNFIDQLPVEIFARQKNSEIHYTLDGSEPTESSPLYTKPIVLSRAGTLKTATYFKQSEGGNKRSTTISATFVRQYPTPSIPDETISFTDQLTVTLKKPGTTGSIHFTLDGTEPTANSARYEKPITLSASAEMVARTIWTHDDGTMSQSELARQRFYHVEKKLPREAAINFQHKNFNIPEGYLVDSGETFRPQPSGCFYGWTHDMRTRVASRGDVHDPLRNTFIHCMADTAWEIEVENGRYEVMVCVGETFYGQERATIYVEGTEFCKDLKLDRKETREITKNVEIKDGRITLTSHEQNAVQKATRLNHLRIRRIE